MRPDQPSPAGQPPKHASAPPPEETDEDLFDFDELAKASTQAAAEMRKELDQALSEVELAKQEVAPLVAAPQPARPTPPRPPPAPQARPAPSAAAEPGPTVLHQKLSLSPLAGALLAAVVGANLVLMLFAWRSVNATRQLVVDVAGEMRDTTTDLRDESTRRSELSALESEPVFGALPEGYRTLQIARERIQRGEHARARRMLYGLLAVIDRLEQPARGEVEAQASFLVADSLRLEADALTGAGREEAR
jgi:hypothetical protein